MAARRIQGQRAPSHDGSIDAAWPPLERAHPRHEFAEVEGFHEIVISARIEALDSIRWRIARGQHQNGGRAVVAPGPRCDLHAGDAWHPPVEDRDIVFIEFQLLNRIVPPVDRVDVVAGIFETLNQDFPQTTIVLRDQHPHR